MYSYLDVKEGLYNPKLRFAFTNILTEEFHSAWDGQPISVPVGATIELPHYLAVKLTKEMVDKIMIDNAKMDEKKAGTPYFRSPLGGMLGVPEARKVFEDKILRQLDINEESPELQAERIRIRQELLADMAKKEGVSSEPMPKNVEEFSQIREVKQELPQIKKPIRIKQIKTAKA